MRHEGAVLAITSILTQHQQSARNNRCSCGWRGDVSKSVIDPNNIHQQHRRHLAEMILDAGVLANAKADALREAAELIEPFSGIGMANGATRGDVSRWLRERADMFRPAK